MNKLIKWVLRWFAIRRGRKVWKGHLSNVPYPVRVYDHVLSAEEILRCAQDGGMTEDPLAGCDGAIDEIDLVSMYEQELDSIFLPEPTSLIHGSGADFIRSLDPIFYVENPDRVFYNLGMEFDFWVNCSECGVRIEALDKVHVNDVVLCCKCKE